MVYDLTSQIRRIVDPLIMKLRADLYGSTYNTTLVESVIPAKAVQNVINQEINNNLILPTYRTYTAGASGVTAGRALTFDGTHVHNADCLTVAHAGTIVGVARADATASNDVDVQIYGELDLPATFSFADQGALFVGISGVLVNAPAVGTAFVQAVGTSLTTTRMNVSIQAAPILA